MKYQSVNYLQYMLVTKSTVRRNRSPSTKAQHCTAADEVSRKTPSDGPVLWHFIFSTVVLSYLPVQRAVLHRRSAV